ncbi:MAG: phosphoglycolate phosphatase [Rhodospirillales bacterium]
MSAITRVIFDLDGTLIDSAADLHQALNVVLVAEGWRPLSLPEVKAIVGDGAAMLVRKALVLAGSGAAPASAGALDAAVRALTPRFLAAYESHAADLTCAYPGVPETLAVLRGRGLALAVCTNKPEQVTRLILRALDLDRYLGAIIGGDSVDGIRKPDPRHLLAAVDALGGIPSETVMVGDSVNDVAAARGLGVPVIIRAGGYGQVPADALGADLVICDFAELPAAIASLP